MRQLPPSSMQSFGGDVNAETEEMLTVGVSGSDSDATQPVSPPLLWRAQAQVMEAPTASLPRVVSDAPATVKTAWDVPAASSAAIFSGHETAVPELMMNFAIFGGASHVLDLAASAPDSTATTLVDALLSRFVGKRVEDAAAVAKERRMAKEERRLGKQKPGKGGGEGAEAPP